MSEATTKAKTVDAINNPNVPENWIGALVPIQRTVPDGKGGNVYEEIARMIVPIPTLKAFGIDSPTRQRTEEDGEDDGLPIYADKAMDWLFYAAVQAAKAKARNKLVPKTGELKQDQHVAETMDELITEGERVGNAAAMKLAAEIGKAFQAWFTGLGKSAAASAMAVTLFRKRDALAIQPNDIKTKMQAYLSQFAETLEPTDAERYAKYLLSVEEACQATTAEDF